MIKKTALFYAIKAVLLALSCKAWGQVLPVPVHSKVAQLLINEQTLDELATNNAKSLKEQITHYQTMARHQDLANHPTWQRLFYVHQGQMSDVAYQAFFLHSEGKYNLSAELDTTIERLFTDTDETSPQCRFPARTHWLIQQLNIDKQQLPTVDCAKFDDWFAKINPHTLTLVFASDYMGNPSSMFGHTLVRLDPPKHNADKNMDLVAYALNYAAMPPPNENSAVYAIKGLTGGYGGEYSLMRYFHKTKEYGDLESRDMWEYQLDLNPDEVAFLVKHIWEMQGVSFPYYFMDKNCSYALLGLIDLVRPKLNLQHQFHFTTIPIETIKAVKKAGLIKQVHYRPALETTLKASQKHYGAKFAKLANQLAHSNKAEAMLAPYDEKTKAALLEMAYDNLYFAQSAGTVNKTFAQKQLRQLLLLRSRINEERQRPQPSKPFDPADGHKARHWGLAMGQVQNQNALSLSYRTAYHALDDPKDGYQAGQLLFLNGAVQIDDERAKLTHLDILSVKSVNPITNYKRPSSWGVDIGYRQIASDDKGQFSESKQHGVAHFALERGYSQAFFDDKLLCGAYGRLTVQAGKVLANNVRAGLSPVIQCQWYPKAKWQALVTLSMPYWDNKQWQQNLAGQVQYHLTPNHILQLTGEYEQQGSQDWSRLMVGYRQYF